MKHSFISLILAILLISMTFTACTDSQDPGKESDDSSSSESSATSFDNIDFTKITLDIASICAEMATKLTLDDELYPVDHAVAENNYQISGLYTELSAYCSSLATAEAVCIIQSEDTEKAAAVKDQLVKYAEKMSAVYSSYNMTESNKLANAYINSFGNYTVFFVSVDSNEAFNLFKEAVLDRVPQ